MDIPTNELIQAINATVRATDPDSTRYALHSVLVEANSLDAAELRLAACDGRRLHLMDLPIGELASDVMPKSAPLIPARMLEVLRVVIGQFMGENVKLLFRDGVVIVGFDAPAIGSKVFTWARLAEGRFPRYQDIFENMDLSTRLDVDRAEFLRLIQLAAITTSEESVGVHLEMGYGRVAAWSQAADVGKGEVDLPIGTFSLEGKARMVCINPHYLIDAINALPPGEDRVRIAFGDDPRSDRRDSPIEIRYCQFTGYIMPMIREDAIEKPKWLDEWSGLPAPVAPEPAPVPDAPVEAKPADPPEPELDPSVDRDIYSVLTKTSATDITFIQSLNDADLPTLRAALDGNRDRKGRQGASKLIDKRMKALTGKGKPRR